MSADTQAFEIVSKLLAYDERPPSEDYNPYDYGEKVGQRITDDDAANIVRVVLRQLPSGIAASFLEGLLSHRGDRLVRKSLIESIPEVMEVTTAANIVDLLRTAFFSEDSKIFDEIKALLEVHGNAENQDRICFAIWSLVCGETHNLETDEVRRFSGDVDAKQIEALISEYAFGGYSRRVLEECVRAMK